jgi:hypothetical protein
MQETAFRQLLQRRIIREVEVCETYPTKGKPARKDIGSTSVWVLKLFLNEHQFAYLESARGGPREWASLDNLNKWLRALGILHYQIHMLPEKDDAMQQELIFS